MLKFYSEISKMFGIAPVTQSKTGMPPGSVKYIGRERTEKIRIDLINYDDDDLQEFIDISWHDCLDKLGRTKYAWINIEGIHDVELVRQVGVEFGVHNLSLEDIVNTEHRPKMEDWKSYLHIVLKRIFIEDDRLEVGIEQISLILKENLVVTFQELAGDDFDSIRKRLKEGKTRIRRFGSDYLMYALMDAIVDNYFVLLEKIGGRLEDLDYQLSESDDGDVLRSIHRHKQQLLVLKRNIWPVRETVSSLVRGESQLLSVNTLIYMRDLYDHIVQVVDTTEIYRDMLSSLTDLYLSTANNKMNEIMKVLTIISTTFIPLGFIVGLYGMNFRYMPELTWHYGYFTVLGLIIVVFAGMMYYFRKRKWL